VRIFRVLEDPVRATAKMTGVSDPPKAGEANSIVIFSIPLNEVKREGKLLISDGSTSLTTGFRFPIEKRTTGFEHPDRFLIGIYKQSVSKTQEAIPTIGIASLR
jgi:hypothetical protein